MTDDCLVQDVSALTLCELAVALSSLLLLNLIVSVLAPYPASSIEDE